MDEEGNDWFDETIRDQSWDHALDCLTSWL
ncbi:hypothetical protein FRAAL4676 [Frankia alni ACN14a]|uniref:Uncharacterized protein n=1 Tax=Frankia alni (strain DSM 45986 / CECT 9034 / ACN14a) TaxID=326424 RepID=Q0RGR8_FRAAA|nr:hypothetical protein FRAAL4676 [Frankia alni ACN14a]